MLFVALQDVLAAGVVNNRPRRAPNRYRMPAVSSEPTRNHMRLTEDQVDMIAAEFHEGRLTQNPKASLYASTRKIEMFLSYVASGGFYRQLAKTEGVATSTASDYVHEVAEFLYETAPRHILFPGPQVFDELSVPLQDPNGRNLNVILYIDGKIVRIQRPDHAGDAYYCGRPENIVNR